MKPCDPFLSVHVIGIDDHSGRRSSPNPFSHVFGHKEICVQTPFIIYTIITPFLFFQALFLVIFIALVS